MNKKFFVIATMVLLMPMTMGAQALKGSYFLDNSLNRNKLNPALTPTSTYFQIPAIGNLGTGIMSNLELSTFLYPMDGQLYTFLNKNVSLEQFDAALARNPYMDLSMDMNLINFGLMRDDGFWTVDVGIRVNADADVPRDTYIFMKKGMGTSGTYDMGQAYANMAASLHAAVGYSRDLSDYVDGLRVGAKARVILPFAYVGMEFNDVSLTADPDKLTVAAKTAIHSAGIDMASAEGDLSPLFDNVGIRGFGFSVDLGAEYNLEFDGFINGLSFSASVTDLGLINYGAKSARTYTSEGTMDWTGFDKISFEEGAMDSAMEDLKNGLSDLFNFKEAGKGTSFSRSTLPSFYVGAEMPFMDNMMSVGALYSARKSYAHMRNELTLSYNVRPLDWLSAGINYSFLNVARTMGFVLELTPRVGPCFFVGFDYLPLSWAKAPENLGFSALPISMRMNLQLGLAVALGGNED